MNQRDDFEQRLKTNKQTAKQAKKDPVRQPYLHFLQMLMERKIPYKYGIIHTLVYLATSESGTLMSATCISKALCVQDR